MLEPNTHTTEFAESMVLSMDYNIVKKVQQREIKTKLTVAELTVAPPSLPPSISFDHHQLHTQVWNKRQKKM